jgi:hypothetical protein
MTGSKRRSLGFILIASIAITFIMVLLVAIMAQVGRGQATLTLLMDSQINQAEAANTAFAELQRTFQDPSSGPGMGWPSGWPTPGAGTKSISTPTDLSDANVTISGGTFNASGNNASLLLPIPGDSYTESDDGYNNVKSDPSSIGTVDVPSRHAIVFLNAKTPNTPEVPATLWASLYSGNYPFGALAPQGSIQFTDARSVDGYGLNETGNLVSIFAKNSVNISGTVNARVFCGAGTGNITLPNGGGIVGVSPDASGTVKLPTDLDFSNGGSALGKAIAEAPNGTQDLGQYIDQNEHFRKSLSDGFGTYVPTDSPYDFVYIPASPWFCECGCPGGAEWPDSSETVLDSPCEMNGGTFEVEKTDWVVGSLSQKQVKIPYPMKIDKNLYLEQGTVMVVDGDLEVDGTIYMAKQSTLVVNGNLNYTSNPLVTTDPSQAPLVSVTLVANNLSLPNGMAYINDHQLVVTPDTSYFTPKTDEPFDQGTCEGICEPPEYNCDDEEDDTLNNGVFTAASAAGSALLLPTLGTYCEDLNVAGVNDTSKPPPGAALIAKSQLSVGGSFASGLMLSQNGIGLTCTTLCGAAMTLSGDINASNCQLRYFPYFTHCFVHANSKDFQCAATMYHRTAFGRIK